MRGAESHAEAGRRIRARGAGWCLGAMLALGVGLLVACGPAGERGSAESGDAGPTGRGGGSAFPAQSRPDVIGTAGAVTAGHPLAAAAGYRVLRRGGNAVDAAVTMAAVLAVVRPHMNGVGGDAFALIRPAGSDTVAALNGSGRAGALASPAFFRERDLLEIPETGALSVSVPGAVSAWAAALEAFGTLELGEALAPAVRYAEEGFPVSSELRRDLAASADALDPAGREIFLPGGEPPPPGSLLRNPALAATLRTLAEKGAEALYGGELGARLAGFVEAEGGYLRPEDFAAHEATWTRPLSLGYLGHRVLTFPPNTQGLVLLQQMGMARHHDLRAMGYNSADYLHTLIELKKVAFADRNRWVADPAFSRVPVDRLLDPAYLEERAGLVAPDTAAVEQAPGPEPPKAGEDAASRPDGGASPGTAGGSSPAAFAGPSSTAAGGRERTLGDGGDTVYLTAVDREGNAVSWIQSLFHSFGSGLVDPETGVVLQNRGALFTLEEGHPNRIAPGKRPFHTLMPAMAFREGRLALVFGTPGGDSQSQSLLQIFHNLHLFGMTPQQAVEAPRFRSYAGRAVAIEARVSPEVRAVLEARGHELRVVGNEEWSRTFGGAQLVYVDADTGALYAAADPRREAYAIAY